MAILTPENRTEADDGFPETQCQTCDAPLVPRRRWLAAEKKLREMWLSLGWARAASAEQCSRCYARTLGTQPRATEPVSADDEVAPRPCERCGIDTTSPDVCGDCKDVVTPDEYVTVWSVATLGAIEPSDYTRGLTRMTNENELAMTPENLDRWENERIPRAKARATVNALIAEVRRLTEEVGKLGEAAKATGEKVQEATRKTRTRKPKDATPADVPEEPAETAPAAEGDDD